MKETLFRRAGSLLVGLCLLAGAALATGAAGAEAKSARAACLPAKQETQTGVTVYSNASILGGDTFIGDGAVIGGSVFVCESVPANARVGMQEQKLNITVR